MLQSRWIETSKYRNLHFSAGIVRQLGIGISPAQRTVSAFVVMSPTSDLLFGFRTLTQTIARSIWLLRCQYQLRSGVICKQDPGDVRCVRNPDNTVRVDIDQRSE